MKIRHKNRLFALTTLGLLVLSGGGCKSIEQPDPVYRVNMEHHLHANMRNMSSYLVELSQLSFNQAYSEDEKTDAVIHILNEIESIATSIGGPGQITNYAVVNRYMSAFLYDVNLAKEFSSRTPPNHFPAYSLVKSCLSCHDSI